MNFKQLNEIIKNSIITNCNAVESTTINTKIYHSGLKAYNYDIFCNIELRILINKKLYPISFKELLVPISQFSQLLILCEEIGKYSKGLL